MSFYDWFVLQKDRTPEGMFSFAHIFSVSIALAIFVGFAYYLGRKFKGNEKAQFFTLLAAGIAIDLVFVAKMVWLLWDSDNIWKSIIGNAPLYLCDMQIFIIPLAALTKGRFRNWCLDFVAIWGMLMGFLGTYFAGNIYYGNCAISYFAINSLLNHAISAFAAIFVITNGLNKMEKRDIPFTVAILLVFMTTALVIDYVDDHNFMFFFHGDGTPFVLFDKLVHEIKPLYQIEIYILQCGYMVGFYFVYYWIVSLINKAKAKEYSINKEKTLNTIANLNWISVGMLLLAFVILAVGVATPIPNGTTYGLIMKIVATLLGAGALTILVVRYFKYSIPLSKNS